MNKKDLDEWYMLTKQIRNGYHISKEDHRRLIFLNYDVMALAHNIHNDNMLKVETKKV